MATALLKALKDRGADRVFGIPGDFVLPFFRAISETDILPLHTLSHEPSKERLQQSLDFIQAREAASTRDQALADLAHVIFNSSEFVYIR